MKFLFGKNYIFKMDDLKENEHTKDADTKDNNAMDEARDHSTEPDNAENDNAKDEIVKDANVNVKVDIENDDSKNSNSKKEDNEKVLEIISTAAKECLSEIEPGKEISRAYEPSCRPKVRKNTLCNIKQPTVKIISSGHPSKPQSSYSLTESTSHQDGADCQVAENLLMAEGDEKSYMQFQIKTINENRKKLLVNKFSWSQQQTWKFGTLSMTAHKSQNKGTNFFSFDSCSKTLEPLSLRQSSEQEIEDIDKRMENVTETNPLKDYKKEEQTSYKRISYKNIPCLKISPFQTTTQPKSTKRRDDTSSVRSSNISFQKQEESKEKHLISEDNKNIAADASLEEGNNSRKKNKKKSKKKKKSQSSNVPKKSEESNPQSLEEIDQPKTCKTEMKESESDFFAHQQKDVDLLFHRHITESNLSSIAQNESKATVPKILIPVSCKPKNQAVLSETEEYIEDDDGNRFLRRATSNYTTRIAGEEIDSKQNYPSKIEYNEVKVTSPPEIDNDSCAIAQDKSTIMQVECCNEIKCDVLGGEQDIFDKKQEFIESMNDAQSSENDLYCSKQIAFDKQYGPIIEEGALSKERNASNSDLDVSYSKLSGSDSGEYASESNLEESNGDRDPSDAESSSSDSKLEPLGSKPSESDSKVYVTDSGSNRNSGEDASNSEQDTFVTERDQLFIQERNAALQMILAKTRSIASAQEKIAVSQEIFVADYRKFAAEKEEFVEKKEEFAEEKRAFAEEKRAFAEEKRAFAEEKRAFAEEKRAFAEEKRAFAEEKRAFAEEKEGKKLF